MKGGVKRVHLLDGTISGVLLLELFKRDGMGTMVARYIHSFRLHSHILLAFSCSYNSILPVTCSDVYEGTRDARVEDLAGIRHIIKPLEESVILVRRTDEEVTTLTIFNISLFHRFKNTAKGFDL